MESPVTNESPICALAPSEYASDSIAEILRTIGYRYLPMVPGSSFRGLHDSLVNHLGNVDPQILLCLHEDAAVAIAHGYAKASQVVCPVMLHDLVGLMHASMGIYNAACDFVPLVIIGGSGPADSTQRRPTEWLHTANTQSEIVRNYTKYTAEPATLSDAIANICRANQLAQGIPPGPTYVSIDMALQEARAENISTQEVAAQYSRIASLAPGQSEILLATEMLCDAVLPVVVGGRIGLLERSREPLLELLDATGAAYVDDQHFVCLATGHPQNLTGDETLLQDADVLVLIDVANVSAITQQSDAQIIEISYGELATSRWSNLNSGPSNSECQIVADPVASVSALAASVSARQSDRRVAERLAGVTSRKRELEHRAAEEKALKFDAVPISGLRLVHELYEAVRDRPWYLTLRNWRNWPAGVWRFGGPGEFLGHSGGAGLGHGPGAMVGGALAARDRGQIGVGIVGDGDMIMGITALWTAAHYHIPSLFVVNDNAAFGNDLAHQERVAASRGRAIANAWIGTRIDRPAVDFSSAARAFGATGIGPVVDPDDLPAAFKEALLAVDRGAAAVVHVSTEFVG